MYECMGVCVCVCLIVLLFSCLFCFALICKLTLFYVYVCMHAIFFFNETFDMHFIYYINRLITTKVDSTYLSKL